MPSRRILAVSYYFPPSPLAGAHRWESMAAVLRKLGHEVTVLTTGASGGLDTDGPWVVRTGDLQTSATLRRLLRRPERTPAEQDGATVVGFDPSQSSRLLTRGLVPDSWVLTWLPYLIPIARRVVRERQIDVLVTNGPPDSTHLLGLVLGRRRPAWIADFDDGWRYEAIMGPWPTRIQDRLDSTLERRVVSSAEAVVGITEPIARDFRERYACVAYDIPSGWDASQLDADVASAAPPKLSGGFVNLVHTGSLSVPERRDPRGLFRALESLVARDPGVATRLRLTLAGAITAHDRRILDALTPPVRGMLWEVGFVPKPQALALQRAADVLLLISTGPHQQVVTAKLAEYLLAERPILAVSSENEAARIIRETQTGVVVAPDDVDAIADALQSCLDGRLAGCFQPRGLERYAQPAPAKEFAAVIEAAIEQRARVAPGSRRDQRRG
ncbi:MAG TPA: glycosyltransferase [Solirubrobacteraceae bacterium]|nr:glycosyltransferase [Solirubrobacteraceae bacterium]